MAQYVYFNIEGVKCDITIEHLILFQKWAEGATYEELLEDFYKHTKKRRENENNELEQLEKHNQEFKQLESSTILRSEVKRFKNHENFQIPIIKENNYDVTAINVIYPKNEGLNEFLDSEISFEASGCRIISGSIRLLSSFADHFLGKKIVLNDSGQWKIPVMIPEMTSQKKILIKDAGFHEFFIHIRYKDECYYDVTYTVTEEDMLKRPLGKEEYQFQSQINTLEYINRNIYKYKMIQNHLCLCMIIWLIMDTSEFAEEQFYAPKIEKIEMTLNSFGPKTFHGHNLEKIKIKNYVGYVIPLSPLVNNLKKMKKCLDHDINETRKLVNYSRIDATDFTIYMEDQNISVNYKLQAEVININIMRYMSGMCGLAYA